MLQHQIESKYTYKIIRAKKRQLKYVIVWNKHDYIIMYLFLYSSIWHWSTYVQTIHKSIKSTKWVFKATGSMEIEEK